RALLPIAVVSWAAHMGWLQLQGTWLAFFRRNVTAYVTTALALCELVTDKLPKTPSRKVPIQFATRIVTGALCGAALGAPSAAIFFGLFLGAVGAVTGTLGCGGTR